MSELFVGSGWAFFPMRTDVTGGIELVGRDREIQEAIRIILATAPGERPMRPEFGCAIHDHGFDTVDATTLGRFDYAIRAALDRWEPRIDVRDVSFDTDRTDEGLLGIEIAYTLRGTSDVRNLVFPFYVIPAEEFTE